MNSTIADTFDAKPVTVELILFLAGFCLILLQFFMIREITTLLLGTEVVIALVTVAWFSGYSVGYALSSFLTRSTLERLAVLTWGLHLTLPFSFRYLGSVVYAHGYRYSLLLLLFAAAFLLSSFFSLLLPKFIDDAGDESLPRLYGIELCGAVTGVFALFLFGGVSPLAIPLLYQTGLAAMVALLLRSHRVTVVVTLGIIVYAFSFQGAEKRSIGYFYDHVKGFTHAESLFSANTPYQKVDIIRSRASGRRYIFLDGLQNYGSGNLIIFNTFLSKLPATLVKPHDTLIVGSGSMESVHHTSALSGKVTTVEIDAAVVEGATRYLADRNQLATVTNWNVVIEDAKRFLGASDKKYDLVVMDLPAPFTVQVGLLHNVEFYTMVKAHLKPEGVISVSLAGTFRKNNPTPSVIAAGLAEAFEQVYVYHPDVAKRSYAIAGDTIPFTRDELRAGATAMGATRTKLWDRDEALDLIGDIPPMRLADMSYPVKRSLRRVYYRLFPEGK